jgi:hypothetical protein
VSAQRVGTVSVTRDRLFGGGPGADRAVCHGARGTQGWQMFKSNAVWRLIPIDVSLTCSKKDNICDQWLCFCTSCLISWSFDALGTGMPI